jgi:hypothetical protein
LKSKDFKIQNSDGYIVTLLTQQHDEILTKLHVDMAKPLVRFNINTAEGESSFEIDLLYSTGEKVQEAHLAYFYYNMSNDPALKP